MTNAQRMLILDFITLAESEIEGIQTGKTRGLRMRDCLGQWIATVREAKKILQEESNAEATATTK